jgi:hypothetical protein
MNFIGDGRENKAVYGLSKNFPVEWHPLPALLLAV